jgi:hypothetical protein
MSSQKLYQYAVTYIDPKDAAKNEVVVEPASVLANDEEHAKRIALRQVDAKWDDKLADLRVDVRPF